MNFIPTIEQVQEAAKRLPDPYAHRALGGPIRQHVMLPMPAISHYEQNRLGAVDMPSVIEFEVHRTYGPQGREWLRWKLRGGVLV